MPIILKQTAFHTCVCVCVCVGGGGGVAHMRMLCGVSICRSELHLSHSAKSLLYDTVYYSVQQYKLSAYRTL